MVDLELLEQGGIAVANRGSEEVRIFSATGRHLLSFGSQGKGPGEFQRLSMLEELADSLLTYDEGNARLSAWRKDGSLIRSTGSSQVSGPTFPLALAGNGDLLAIALPRRTAYPGVSGLAVDSAQAVRLTSGGELIGTIPRVPWRQTAFLIDGEGQTMLDAPFSTWVQLTVEDGLLCYSFGPQPELRCHDGTGTLRRIIRLSLPPRRVSEADEDAFWQEKLEEPASLRREGYLSMRNQMEFPQEFPAFAQILPDSQHRLWVRLYPQPGSTAEQWVVLESGRLIGSAATPLGFQVMDIEGSLIAGTWKDDLGIEFVHVYQFASR